RHRIRDRHPDIRRRVLRSVTIEAEDPAEAAPTVPTAPTVVTADSLADDLAFALELADRAGAVLTDHYERLEQIDYKSADDVRTEADHLSEALVLDAIRARFPTDALLAEETGGHQAT